jgi:hypothetical protein
MIPHGAQRQVDRPLTLAVLPEPLAICRLAPDAPIPAWATQRAFFAVTRTGDELSVVCRAAQVPSDIVADRQWRALKLLGPFELSLVGILLSVAAPLAGAGVTIFPIATYDTDYLLVRQDQLTLAIQALTDAGHRMDDVAST